MIKNRKSQVAIFIILAMFILIAFLFVYNLKRTLSTTFDETTVEQHLVIVNNDFEEFFEICVEQETEFYVDMIMKQGGYIYLDQGGLVKEDLSNIPFTQKLNVNSTDIFGNNVTINYGINNFIETSYDISKNFKGNPAALSLDLLSGDVPVGLFNKYTEFPFFGTNILPKLCNRDGPNSPSSNLAFTCIPSLYNKGDSDANFTIQSQLNNVLSTAIKGCYETKEVNSLYDVSYKGDGAVSLTFGDDDISFYSNVTITYGSAEKTHSFNASYLFPIRLKKLYTLGYLIAEKDTKEIHFDKRTDFKNFYSCNGNCWDSFIYLEQKRDFFKNSDFNSTNIKMNFDDLVIVKDRKTTLHKQFLVTNKSDTPFNKDEQMTLIYMVQNRRPYLERIPNLPLSTQVVFSDIEKEANLRKVYFNIKVMDPDDGDALDIYNKTFGDTLIFTSSYGNYREEGSSNFIADSTLSPFSTLNIPVDQDEITYNITLTCGDDSTNQCHECGVAGCYFQKDYYNTQYFLNITAKDSGNLSDEQLFNLSIEYK